MKAIIFIFPGPTYRPHSGLFYTRFQALSTRYRGYILTTTPSGLSGHIGRFLFRSVPTKNDILSTIRFILFCLSTAIRLAASGERIDLVVTYDPLKTGFVGLLVASILGAKLSVEVNGVYSARDVWEDSSSSSLARFKRFAASLLMGCVLRCADGIKLLFESQLGSYRRFLHKKMIRVFPNLVGVTKFQPHYPEKLEILFVGFPFRLKGVDILIKAFKTLAPDFPEWKLKILGWYPDPRELKAAIDNHPQISFHQPVPHDQMPIHIGSCAIFVLPSRSEAMGRVLVEAMGAGRARIGSNVHGIPTLIRHGTDGLLFNAGDADDLSEKMRLLMQNPDLRKTLGDTARTRALVEFNEDQYFRRIFEFYDELLEH